MDLLVFPLPIPPPTSLSTRSLWVFPVHQARALVSCIQPACLMHPACLSRASNVLVSWIQPVFLPHVLDDGVSAFQFRTFVISWCAQSKVVMKRVIITWFPCKVTPPSNMLCKMVQWDRCFSSFCTPGLSAYMISVISILRCCEHSRGSLFSFN